MSSKINWPWRPLFTFNPVAGCKRGCNFCYANRLHTMRYEARRRGAKLPECYSKPFTEVRFFPERLKQRFKPGSHVFIGSMSDIEYWHETWIRNIIDYCAMNPTVNFYFLSKNSIAYSCWTFPDNCCLGLTMTLTQTGQCQYEMMSEMIRHKRCFLSLEPLLGELKVTGILHMFEKIIIGAMTGPGAVKPEKEWIDSIKKLEPCFAHSGGLRNIYWKNNIRKGKR